MVKCAKIKIEHELMTTFWHYCFLLHFFFILDKCEKWEMQRAKKKRTQQANESQPIKKEKEEDCMHNTICVFQWIWKWWLVPYWFVITKRNYSFLVSVLNVCSVWWAIARWKSVRVRTTTVFSEPMVRGTRSKQHQQNSVILRCVFSSLHTKKSLCESCEFKLNVYDFCILFHSRSRSYSCFFRNGVIMFFFCLFSLLLLLLVLNHLQQTILLDFAYISSDRFGIWCQSATL